MAFNIFMIAVKKKTLHRRTFWYYCLASILTAFVITFPSLFIAKFEYDADYGCWFVTDDNYKRDVWVFYYGPLSVTALLNVFLAVSTYMVFSTQERKLKKHLVFTVTMFKQKVQNRREEREKSGMIIVGTGSVSRTDNIGVRSLGGVRRESRISFTQRNETKRSPFKWFQGRDRLGTTSESSNGGLGNTSNGATSGAGKNTVELFSIDIGTEKERQLDSEDVSGVESDLQSDNRVSVDIGLQVTCNAPAEKNLSIVEEQNEDPHAPPSKPTGLLEPPPPPAARKQSNTFKTMLSSAQIPTVHLRRKTDADNTKVVSHSTSIKLSVILVNF
ncbi:hypothetical protein HDV05_007668 [Chytridiales sp. JEL 0842]|nr:hypothetical protein HDV05_007668 [Chytridiales sp. JEL 0842]